MHIAWAVGVLNGSAIGFEVHQFNRSPRMLGTMKRTFSVSLFAVVYCRRASLFPYLVRPYSFCFIVSTRRTQFWASIIRFFWRARTASDCACDWHRSFCIILILFCFFFFTMTSSLLRVLNVQSSHTSAFKCLRYAKKALFPRYRPFNWLATDTKCCNKFSLFSFDSTKTNTTTTIGSFTRFTKVWC